MIKQVLFDCGGVFVDIQFRQLMEKITGNPEQSRNFIARLLTGDSPWANGYDRGDYETAECCARLIAYFPEIDPKHIEAFMQEWPKWLIPFPEMETIIPELHKAGKKCYLLSNFSHRFDEFRQYCPGLKDLDGEIISHKIHLLKPGKEIFDYAASYYKIKPEETLFVDDTLHNVEGARAAGYQGYHFTDAAALRQYLKEQNIL